MENKLKTIELKKGRMAVYDFGSLKLHAYETNDPLNDEVFVVENAGRGFVIEPPCFAENIVELEDYIAAAGIRIKGIVTAYHMAGASFLQGIPVYGTVESDAYGHRGGGRDLVDGFCEVFGDAFDGAVYTVTDMIEGDALTLAGVDMRIVPNDDAFDIEIPAMNATYIHMMGHDCHSIVAGAGQVDALIGQLERLEQRGFDLILTSHHRPETRSDLRRKKAYLFDVGRLARESDSAASFRRDIMRLYPNHGGLNYLDMTEDFLFPRR